VERTSGAKKFMDLGGEIGVEPTAKRNTERKRTWNM
jgi:hypothetical protein